MMANKTYQLERLTCPSCAAKIEAAVRRIKGVSNAEVLFNSSKLKVSYDESALSDGKIKETVNGLGYEVLGEK